MRALIYARYSTTLQSEASIDDQVRICRELAEREGWAIAGVHTDYAISGAVRERPGLNAMMAAIAAGTGDVVVAESIDRLSRDQEDIAGIFKRIAFAGARIHTTSEGAIGELHIGLKGTMSALFRKDLADKVRRGQTGRVLAGRCPGGLTYGYRRVSRFDEAGEPLRGLREVDHDQAEVIRRIFAEFLAGRSPRDIAYRLNAEGVPGPTHGPWAASTINGDRVRANGILQNELYRGVQVFNRTTRVYDPETRRKRIRPNPPESWTRRPAPELRIVDDSTWAAVTARRRRFDGTRCHQQRRQKHLLSGLVRCGLCGDQVRIVSRRLWGCGRRERIGDCTNNRLISGHLLEQRVLAGLADQLLDPDVVAAVVQEYHAAAKERSATEGRDRRSAERRLAQAQAKVDRLLRAVTDGGAEFAEIRAALAAARAELQAAEDRTGELGAGQVIALHPRIAEEYRRTVQDLRGLLEATDDDHRLEAQQQIRGLIERVVVTPPKQENTELKIAVEGRLAALLTLAGGTPAQTPMYFSGGAPGRATASKYMRLKRAEV